MSPTRGEISEKVMLLAVRLGRASVIHMTAGLIGLRLPPFLALFTLALSSSGSDELKDQLVNNLFL